MDSEKLFKCIKKYQSDPSFRDYNNKWIDFWERKCRIETNGVNIFSEEHLDETSTLLKKYLQSYKMTRFEGGLDETRFRKAVINFCSSINSLEKIKFGELRECHKEIVQSACNKISEEMGKINNRADSQTMVSKILMACWGQTPAFDSHFRKSFMDEQKINICPATNHLFYNLMDVQHVYLTNWKNALSGFEEKYIKTPEKYQIPHARLIDMAFWELGRSKKK